VTEGFIFDQWLEFNPSVTFIPFFPSPFFFVKSPGSDQIKPLNLRQKYRISDRMASLDSKISRLDRALSSSHPLRRHLLEPRIRPEISI